MRRERRKTREERDRLQSKEGSNCVEEENREQKQRVEKSHNKRSSPKNKQRPETLDLHKANKPTSSQTTMNPDAGHQSHTRKSKAPPPQSPPPNSNVPLGQSLSTLHLNLTKLAHIRTRVGLKFFYRFYTMRLLGHSCKSVNASDLTG